MDPIKFEFARVEQEETTNNVNVESPTSPSPSLFNPMITCTPEAANTSTRSSKSRLTLLDGRFFKFLPGNSSPQKTVALCMRCSPKEVLVKGYTNSTSNFLSHLKRKHGEETVEEYKSYVKTKKLNLYDNLDSSGADCKTSSVSATNMSSAIAFKALEYESKPTQILTQEEFNKDVAKFFIHSMMPLRIVEDPYFMKLFLNLNIKDMNLKVMSQQWLCQHIQNCYIDEMAEIASKLHSIDHVCTTVDIWSTGSGGYKPSFIGVTAHWITNELRRASVALACRRFNGMHSNENITAIVEQINGECGLTTSKITATLTDNNINFFNAFKLFGVDGKIIHMKQHNALADPTLSDNSDYNEDVEEKQEIQNISNRKFSILPAHLHSCAQTLSLCATIDANEVLSAYNETILSIVHNAVLAKCNALWKAAAHYKGAAIVSKIVPYNLRRPSETSWNSLYNALQQILAVKDKNLELHNALNIENHFEDSEYVYLQEHLKCAAPVAEALDIMQDEHNTFYGIVLPCLFALRKKLDKINRKNNFIYCKPLIETYIASIERRFETFFDVTTPESQNAAIAALSFPRFKNKWLACVEPTNEFLNLFKMVLSKEINDKPATQLRATRHPTRKEDAFFNFNSSDSDSEDSDKHLKSYVDDAPLTKAELLMLHFFDDENQQLEDLNWYPAIRKVFIKYNTVLASSAPVERLFPSATMSNLPENHSISAQMFEKRMVLKANLLGYKIT